MSPNNVTCPLSGSGKLSQTTASDIFEVIRERERRGERKGRREGGWESGTKRNKKFRFI